MRTTLTAIASTAIILLATIAKGQWQSVRNGLPSDGTVETVTASGDRLFAGTNDGGYYSTNLGQSWAYCANFPDSARQQYYRNSARFYSSGSLLFVSASYQMLMSTDNGTTWQWDTNGLNGKKNVMSFGSDDSMAYLAVHGGLFQQKMSDFVWNQVVGDFPKDYSAELV